MCFLHSTCPGTVHHWCSCNRIVSSSLFFGHTKPPIPCSSFPHLDCILHVYALYPHPTLHSLPMSLLDIPGINRRNCLLKSFQPPLVWVTSLPSRSHSEDTIYRRVPSSLPTSTRVTWILRFGKIRSLSNLTGGWTTTIGWRRARHSCPSPSVCALLLYMRYICYFNSFIFDHSHSLIWRPSRVADTPPLLPISRYGYCLFVADVCLCSEVLQPGSSWSSSGSGSM